MNWCLSKGENFYKQHISECNHNNAVKISIRKSSLFIVFTICLVVIFISQCSFCPDMVDDASWYTIYHIITSVIAALRALQAGPSGLLNHLVPSAY